MKLTALRRLIREMILIEQTQAPARAAPATPAAPAAPATGASANVPSYHTQNSEKAANAARAYAQGLSRVGGWVFQITDGKVTFSSGTILPNGALIAVGGVPVLKKFALGLEKKFRESIKKGHWAISNPTQWRKNVLSWQNPQTKKPYFASEGEAANFQSYFVREMDTMPITFLIADPAVSDSKRVLAAENVNIDETTWAAYSPDTATYLVNLITPQGWSTLKPSVQTSDSDKALSPGPERTTVVSTLKAAIAAGGAEVQAPRHEFGHADEMIVSHFMQVRTGVTTAQSTQSADEQLLAQDKAREAMNQVRLAGFKKAVSSYSSDLIGAKSNADVTNALLKRHSALGNAQSAKNNPRYLQYVIEYAAVLVSLGLIKPNHPLYVFGSGDGSQTTATQASPTTTLLKTIGSVAGIEVPGNTQQVGEAIGAYLSKGAVEPFSSEHILDALKMVQQNMDPSATDVSAAMLSLQQTGAVGQEDLRRARVLADLAGPNFFSAVQTVAAADALPQNSSSA
jgi:hypothetical protein